MDGLLKKKTLYVVATPIGHLGDMSPRAMDTIKQADIILAEDTRTTTKLVKHLGLPNVNMMSYHDRTTEEKRSMIVDRIESEELSAVLVSDAGTPCISDPGYKLVRDARKRGIGVEPVPGPSALATLVSVSGLPSDRVLFIGFLPHKESAVRHEIQKWQNVIPTSIVFFDSLRRLERDLLFIQEYFPRAKVAVGRELTKMYEEIVVNDIEQAIDWIQAKSTLKGEVTVQLFVDDVAEVEDIQEIRHSLITEAQSRFRDGATLKDLLREFRERGLSRSELYALLLEAKELMTSS